MLPDGAREVLLSADSVTKRFGGLTAVDSVSIAVLTGEILGLIGPNGAGKTTLFNLLAGSMHVDAGRITFEGRDVTNASASRMCDLGVTRTFQNPRPFRKLTVLQNVVVGGIAKGGSVRGAQAEAVQILDRVGLLHRRDDAADMLPLGQLKRLEIARCLATRPKLLLLDEPTGGLGTGDLEDLAGLIGALPSAGLTIVLIEHNMRFAMRLCGRIEVLNFGHVIASGTGREISANAEVIAAYLGDETEARAAVRSDA
jgi:ABC-type branched-subunit amino acid transport system ATPase component